jgi:hypothetical protein
MPLAIFRPCLSQLSALTTEEITERFSQTSFGDIFDVLEANGMSEQEFVEKVQQYKADTRLLAGQYLEKLYCEDWHPLNPAVKCEIEYYIEDRILSTVRFPKGTELYCRLNRHTFTLAEDLLWGNRRIKATNNWPFYFPENVEVPA